MKCKCKICKVEGEFIESTDVICVPCYDSIAKESYKRGLREGLRAFAWWKDGVQYVGTCGKTLQQALEEVD